MVGFAVRKPPSSVERNRLRRLLRESYRQRKHALLSLCQERSIALRCVFLIDAKSHQHTTFHAIDAAVEELVAALHERLMKI